MATSRRTTTGINYDVREQQAFHRNIQRWDYSPAGNYADLVLVLTDFQFVLKEKIKQLLRTIYNALKLQVVVNVSYVNASIEDSPPFSLYLRSSNYLIWGERDIDDAMATLTAEIIHRNDNAIHLRSNVSIHRIDSLTIFISRFQPLSAFGYKPLPRFLRNKHAIVNVQNRDHRCFGYSILAALYPMDKNPQRAKRYDPLFSNAGLLNLDYPVSPDQIPIIERKLNLRINVFTFFDDEGKGRHPLYISKRTDINKEIDLLYWDGHYAWIKKFSAFIYDLSNSHYKKIFCKKCFGVFLNENSYARHVDVCNRPDFESIIYDFPPEGSFLFFKHIRYQLMCPFVIYADFEAILKPNDICVNGAKLVRTKLYQHHIPSAVGVYIVSAYEEIFSSRYVTYTGPDVVEWFLKYINETSKELVRHLKIRQRLVMTAEDENAYNSATMCHICGQPFEASQTLAKVKDHDHLTGKYRGAAHMFCNIQFQHIEQIPVFFHNFRGYDSHLITLFLDRFPKENVSLIAQGYEKYLTIRFGSHILFKDSYQFLSYSLDSLASELARSGENRFYHMKKQFPYIQDEQRKLLFKKGVFPYEYMDDWERFNEETLPPKQRFDSTLRQAKCTDEQYSFAQTVWREFNCKNLKDYQDLYLKTDVLLLADVFENFRKFSLDHYKLDPAYYVSSPQLSWDAMLLYTGVRIGLMHDPEMFSMIDAGIRGGVAMIVHRYAKANNPEMGTFEYDPNQELSYIVYVDANNLYGWAMSQYLPIDDFTWLRKEEWQVLDWTQMPENSEYGYILECDLEYPQHLHDAHSDYPLAPERKLIEWEKYSETQIRILHHYSIPPKSLKVQKLIPHLLQRRNYVLHYRNLQCYLKNGLLLQKVHKVIRFRQSNWLAPYIKKNQDLRASAKTDFEKNQPKLYNNSIYGKTCENQKKRSDIRLSRNETQCKRLIEKPQMRGFKIFTKQLAAIDLRKTKAKIDKPFVVGFTVLELSKLLMYSFHYDYIKAKFGNAAQLLFTDTDSLMYHIHGCNPYEQFFKDHNDYFDFASFPVHHKYHNATNNKVIGKFSDEANGKVIKEFVGLRPKMYSFIFGREGREAGKGDQIVGKNRAKGIQYQVAKQLKHEDFLSQLNNPHENRFVNRRIGSKLHELYTIEVNKRGLCSFDDKRVLLEDGISSLPYGHYRITAERIPVEHTQACRSITIHKQNKEASVPKHISHSEPFGKNKNLIRKRKFKEYESDRHTDNEIENDIVTACIT